MSNYDEKYPQMYEDEPIQEIEAEEVGRDNNNVKHYLTQANNLLTETNNLLNTSKGIASLYFDCKKMKEQTKQMQEWSKVEITKTAAKFKSSQDFLDKTFGEREKSLGKIYDLLDKGIESDNKEYIIAALAGISSIVTKSPLDDFEKFVELYNDRSKPLLDF